MKNQYEPQQASHKPDQDGIAEMPLSELTTEKTGVVSRLEGGKEFMNRVACLGFTIGAQVTVLHNQGQGPMIVSMRGAHLALGRQEADKIRVQPI